MLGESSLLRSELVSESRKLVCDKIHRSMQCNQALCKNRTRKCHVSGKLLLARAEQVT
jgi:hypothetical protein